MAKQKKKKERLIWKDSPAPWEKLVLTKIYKRVIKMPFFTSTKGCSVWTTDFNMKKDAEVFYKTKDKGSNTHRKPPGCITINIPYKTIVIKIEVRWSFEWNRGEITTEYPNAPAYLKDNSYEKKYYGSKYMNGVLTRIDEAVRDSIPYAEQEVKAKAEKKRAKLLHESEHAVVEEILEVELKTHHSRCSNERNFTFKATKNYGMDIAIPDTKPINDKSLFSIECIEGDYTLAEIRKIIEIVGSNPRAAAERLRKG